MPKTWTNLAKTPQRQPDNSSNASSSNSSSKSSNKCQVSAALKRMLVYCFGVIIGTYNREQYDADDGLRQCVIRIG